MDTTKSAGTKEQTEGESSAVDMTVTPDKKPKVEFYLRLRDSLDNHGQNSPRSKPENRICRTGES